jgi:hypothetical protein
MFKLPIVLYAYLKLKPWNKQYMLWNKEVLPVLNVETVFQLYVTLFMIVFKVAVFMLYYLVRVFKMQGLD